MQLRRRRKGEDFVKIREMLTADFDESLSSFLVDRRDFRLSRVLMQPLLLLIETAPVCEEGASDEA